MRDEIFIILLLTTLLTQVRFLVTVPHWLRDEALGWNDFICNMKSEVNNGITVQLYTKLVMIFDRGKY